MRKLGVLLSMLVLIAIVLTACGGGATSTNVVESPPPVTVDTTEDMSGTATESPATQEGIMAETPGVPVTGDVNPARLSNQLDFRVWSQDGEQIGDVEDMVLDLDNTEVAYVVVGTGGLLDLGEREILVPWDSLQLQTGTGDTTGGQQNAFILQTDLDTFRNAPDFDPATHLPQMGQTAGDWDVDIRNYWQDGGADTGDTASTPEAGATADPNATATAGTEQGTGTTGHEEVLLGVILASDVLNSTITLGGQSQGTGVTTATAEGTATTGTGSTDQGDLTVTMDDMIIDTNTTGDSGKILYLVVTSTFVDGERWIPVPLTMLQWDATNNGFRLNADAAMLQNAPSFKNSQYPDTTTTGWNSEFDTFWQNNSGGTSPGSGSDAQATPTP